MKYTLVAAALTLAACSPAPAPVVTTPAPAEAAVAAPVALDLKPSGPAVTVAAAAESMPEAFVTDIHMLKDGSAKLFSTAGGDPAINGLYTYIAIWNDPDQWSKVFQIGDFNSWDVVEEGPGRVVLKVSRSWIEEGTGDIKTADEHLILTLPKEDGGKLEVTPAA